jgi:hypothetical protein
MKIIPGLVIALVMIGTDSTAQIRRGGGGGGARVEETTKIINECERKTNGFKKTLDRALARDNVRAGQGREDQLNANASRLENQFDKIGDSWNKDHDMNKTRSHVQAALVLGSDINKAMRNWNMGGDAESEWNALRAGLNRLATNFGLPHIR